MLFVPYSGLNFNKTPSYTAGTRPINTLAFPASPTFTPNNTTNAYSAYTQIGADLTRDCYGLYINFNLAFTATVPRATVVSVGVDYAGGTTWTELFGGLMASEAHNYVNGGVWYYFPIYIPAGASVALASRGNSGVAFAAYIHFIDSPPDPSSVKKASFVETLGLTLGAGTATGTTVTPAAAAADTAWTLIGTTTKRCWWWQYGVQQLGDTTMIANAYHIDIGVGDGTAAGTTTIIQDSYRRVTADESYNNIPDIVGADYVVPAGRNIYARIHNAGANDGGTYQVVVYGCGG